MAPPWARSAREGGEDEGTVAVLIQAAVRGVAEGGSRQAVAAAAAAAIRTGAELLGLTAPVTDETVEVEERVNCVRPVLRAHVRAGVRGLRASIPGVVRSARNVASHHGFGAGPGRWRSAACGGGSPQQGEDEPLSKGGS